MCLVAKHVLPWDRNKPLSHRCTLYINVARYLGVKVGVPMDANSIHRLFSTCRVYLARSSTDKAVV